MQIPFIGLNTTGENTHTKQYTYIYGVNPVVFYEEMIHTCILISSPQGSKQLYRLIIHPFLVRHEEKIDQYLAQAGKQGLQAVRRLSREGINKAASTVVSSAMRVTFINFIEHLK